MIEAASIFVCTQCGYCCHGQTTVSLDEQDRRNMVAALGIPEHEVAEKYWNITGATVQMKTVDGHCVFYRDGCSVYEGRPWRCRQWPLVPALLDDESNFIIIGNSCPGINRHVSYQEFRKILAGLKRR
ncbi:MAG: YkgJ family cysteine cluster protein [Desulfofustis sp.]|jgi:Fe-S-cluster containining protein|nr:YkgJ family cysteine cluster protein [Desulfofustis sp.]